jgi:hypothetical protein
MIIIKLDLNIHQTHVVDVYLNVWRHFEWQSHVKLDHLYYFPYEVQLALSSPGSKTVRQGASFAASLLASL